MERCAQAPYKNRRVYFRSLVTPEKVEFTIRDEGPGFDTSQLPKSSDPDSFKDGTGRGLVLIQAFMDTVTFDRNGTELKMTKLRSEDPANPA